MKKMIAGASLLFLMSLAVTGYSQQNQNPPARPPKISTEERLKHLDTDVLSKLSITDDQKKKVNDVMKDFFNQMEDWHKKHPQQKPEGADFEKIRDSRNTKLKGIFTAEQFKKFQELEKQMLDKMKQQGPPPQPQQKN